MDIIEKAIILASNKFKLKCYEEVELICNQITKVNSENLEALYLSAISKYKLKKVKESLEIIDKLKKIDSYESNNYIGLFYLQIGNIKKSIYFFSNCIELDPKKSSAWSNLACQLRVIKKTNLAIEFLKKAHKIENKNEQVIVNLAGAYAENLEIKKSIKYLKKAIDINPKNYAACVDLSYALFLNNKYKSAYEYYQYRFENFDYLKEKINLFKNNKKWIGQNIKNNKTILFFTEQGSGDTINFIRFVENFREKYPKVKIKIWMPSELSDLFLNKNEITEKIVPHDYFCSILDLPYYLNLDKKQIKEKYKPYIKPTKKCDFSKFKDNYKIGICWAGNPNHPKDSDRSIPLYLFEELYDIPKVKLFSLQKDLRKRIWPYQKNEIDLAYSNKIKMIDMSKHMNSWDDTASIINELDLIITVDTSILHLSGAMNKKTYAIIPYFPDWRWGLKSKKTIWYPNVTLFRQKNKNNWKSVFDEIKSNLINNIY